jgi:NMD protein affecting ribosome stability and mRNA decay
MRPDKPANYFEGILQLRECSKEVYEYVEEQCLKDQYGAYSKIERVINGYDFYMQYNPFLRKLGKRLKNNFEGQLTETATLHTKDRQSNKELYRVTVLFRQSDFSKGDKIDIQGEEYEVVMTGKKVIVKKLPNGKKEHFTIDKLKELKVRKIR